MSTQRGTPIIAGYDWSLPVQVVTDGDPAFPVGVALAAHVRYNTNDDTRLAELTSANGGVERVSNTQIVLTIAGSVSANWRLPVVLDLVRTDLAPDQHYGFRLRIPVVQSVTRGLTP